MATWPTVPSLDSLDLYIRMGEDLEYGVILTYFIIFFSLLVAFGPKAFVFTPKHHFLFIRFGRALLGRRIMSMLTQWVPNGPGKALISHCRTHAMDESGPVPNMDEWYFAHRTQTSVLRGRIGEHSVVVKVWRGAHMRAPAKVIFVQQLSQELDNWKRASSHPNIAPFLGVMSGFGPLPSLVQPFFKNGNINDYLGKHLDADPLYMLSCVADALDYMHNLTPPVTHGGVRGTNILISNTGVPQLSDTSICSMPHSPDLTYMSGEFLNTRWMAPEIIDPPPGSQPGMSACGLETGYETPRSDVYSFGMTVLEVLTGRHPFAHRRMHTGVIFDVVQGIRPPRPECARMTDAVWDIVRSCWRHDPRERPGMGTVGAWLRLVCLMPGCGRGEGGDGVKVG